MVCGCFDGVGRLRSGSLQAKVPVKETFKGATFNETPQPLTIRHDAPLVQCFFNGARRHDGPRRLALTKDVLAIGTGPGEADESLLLSRAEVRVQGAVVLVATRHAPLLTLWCDSAAEADTWAAQLQDASQLAERVHIRSLVKVSQAQRAHQEKVAMLESRVAATLKAAVERTRRINELEQQVAEGKKRDQRIKELETAVVEKSLEAHEKFQRVKELEEQLANQEGSHVDPQSSAELQDAMRFAAQMLGKGDDLMLDGGTALQLKQAVEEVQRAKSNVSKPVADLVQRLVSALRWPLALRNQLATATKTIREQKEIQDKTMKQMEDLQKKQAKESLDRRSSEAEVQNLKQQLMNAENRAETALREADDFSEKYKRALDDLDTASSTEEMQKLRTQRDAETAKRKETEAETDRLRVSLAEAERLAEDARDNLKNMGAPSSSREAPQEPETEAQRPEAEDDEFESETAVADRVADIETRQKKFDEAHEEKLRALRERFKAAEASRHEAEKREEQAEADCQNLADRLAAAAQDSPKVSSPEAQRASQSSTPFDSPMVSSRSTVSVTHTSASPASPHRQFSGGPTVAAAPVRRSPTLSAASSGKRFVPVMTANGGNSSGSLQIPIGGGGSSGVQRQSTGPSMQGQPLGQAVPVTRVANRPP